MSCPGAWVMLVSSNRTDLCKKENEQRGAGAAGLIVAMLQHGHVAVYAVAVEPHVLLRIFDGRESACVPALDAEHHPSTPRDGGDRVILVACVQACQVGSAL